VRRAGGKLLFSGLSGPAEIYVDGVKVAARTDPEPGALTAPLSAKEGERTVAVLMTVAPRQPFGMSASVIVGEGQ
jgi:beta-galactosidase